jgi:hypothetical protein
MQEDHEHVATLGYKTKPCLKKKKSLATSQATMAHASNSSYSGGRDQIRRMVVQSTQFIRPYLKKEKQKTQHKIGLQSGSNDREPA